MEWFTKQTFGSLLDSAAERMGDRPALTFEGKEFSFLDLQTEAHGVARALIASEVSPGEIVALWMDNRPEWIHTQFGTALAGATLLPVNTNLRANDLAYILRHSRCSTLILASRSGPVSYQSILEDVLNSDSDGSWSDLKRIVVLDADVVPEGWLGWSDFLRAGSTVSDDVLAARAGSVSPDDPALVMYTSGTTGKPKGVVHSHHAIRNVTDQANRLGVTEVDVTVIFLPLFHAYGFYEGPLLTLVTGARMVLLRRFQPDETLKAIEDERGTMCFGFVTHFSDLLSFSELRASGSLHASSEHHGGRSSRYAQGCLRDPAPFRGQGRVGLWHDRDRTVRELGLSRRGRGAQLRDVGIPPERIRIPGDRPR